MISYILIGFFSCFQCVVSPGYRAWTTNLFLRRNCHPQMRYNIICYEGDTKQKKPELRTSQVVFRRVNLTALWDPILHFLYKSNSEQDNNVASSYLFHGFAGLGKDKDSCCGQALKAISPDKFLSPLVSKPRLKAWLFAFPFPAQSTIALLSFLPMFVQHPSGIPSYFCNMLTCRLIPRNWWMFLPFPHKRCPVCLHKE